MSSFRTSKRNDCALEKKAVDRLKQHGGLVCTKPWDQHSLI